MWRHGEKQKRSLAKLFATEETWVMREDEPSVRESLTSLLARSEIRGEKKKKNERHLRYFPELDCSSV